MNLSNKIIRKIIFLKVIFIVLILLSQFAAAYTCQYERPIIEKPIKFDQERINLTREYQKTHYGITSDSIKIDPKMIVLHWTQYETLDESFDAFDSPRIDKQKRVDIASQGDLNVSAHFLVDKEGRIYRLMRTNWMARHVIGLNHYAIGIENVGGANGKQDLTEEQVHANAYLVCYLKNKYPKIKYLIGHMEYTKFENTPLWLEKDSTYKTTKVDPGEIFLTQVRELTKDLNLLSDYQE